MASSVKSLSELPKLGVSSVDTLCERLLSCLASYQQANQGRTPEPAVIANQLGIEEGAVMPLLFRLENKGAVHIISRKPLRLMLTKPGLPMAETDGKAQPGAYDRYLDAEAERMRLARFIADTERNMGNGPSLRAMVDFVGWAEPARVHRMAELLARKGIIQFGPNLPTRMTPQGRQMFGLPPLQNGAKKMEQAKERAPRVVVMTNRRPPVTRVNELCEKLAAHIRSDPTTGHYVHYNDLGKELGFSGSSSSAVTGVVAEAVRVGYIMPKPAKARGLFFTDKGIAKFMPELVAKLPDFADVEEPGAKPEGVSVGMANGQPVPPDSAWQPDPQPETTVHDFGPMDDNSFRHGGWKVGEPQQPGVYQHITASSLAHIPTSELVMELVERGYFTRRRG